MRAAGQISAAVAARESHRASPFRFPLTLRKGLPYALIAPATLVIAGVLGWPLVMLFSLSLQHYGLRQLFLHQGTFVGLQNYASILSDPQFVYTLRTTVIFTAVNVGLSMVLALLIALLMERVSRPVRMLVGAGLVFVWATPVIPAVNLWQWMFDYEFGVINWLLTHAGAGNYMHHNWFEHPLEGFTVITVIVVWGAIPFLAIALNAALTQVPADLVEAAEIDGARPWQVFLNVTVPVLRPTLLVLLSLSTIWDFGVFNQVWVLLNQRPSSDYYLMSIYSFEESFRVSQYGLGSAIAVIMIAILVVSTFLYVRQTVRNVNEAA
ncbi:MAG TPA: sugar ABC transporter permease [Candidatus Dormibacteraeota bacterium]|nr:sugar ABC transporter permease [Candidatus Dormibacteraeota bacterium]